MNKCKKIKTITDLVDLYKKNQESCAKLRQIFNGEMDIIDTLWMNFDHCIKLISESTGISIEAITWFIYENEYGINNGHVGTPDTEILYYIRTVKDFVEFETGDLAELHMVKKE